MTPDDATGQPDGNGMQGGGDGLPLTSAEAALRSRLERARAQHAALEAELTEMRQTGTPDSDAVRLLKVRKLRVRDEIARLEAALYPDLIA